jgi:hypothetical protein
MNAQKQTYENLITCNKVTELGNAGKFLNKVKCKWEK